MIGDVKRKYVLPRQFKMAMASETPRLFLTDDEKEVLIERYFDLEFVDDVSELRCGRCDRVLIHHYEANCAHLFCRNCKRVLTFGQGWKCPRCREYITNIDVQKEEVERRVNELKVFCLNHRYGCAEIMTFKELPSHVAECKETREAILPAVYHGTNTMEAVVNRLKVLSDNIVTLRDELARSRIETETSLSVEMKDMDDKLRDDMARKMDKVERRVKGLRSDFYVERTRWQTNAGGSNTQRTKTESENIAQLVLQGIITEVEEIGKRYKNELQQQIEQCYEKQKEDFKTKFQNKKRCINILLVGETGNGKSTLINAFANYSAYKTFSEAMNGDPVCVIPAKFTVTDDDYNESVMTAGADDANECMEIGESGTMACKSYVFDLNECLQVRWIDSSGFAASQGPQHDDNSLNDISSYIAQYNEIHAIAIVIAGDLSQLTTAFQYNVQQLMLNFHKSAINNLITIVTHTTSENNTIRTFYKYIKDIESRLPATPKININKKNVFWLDNKPFQDLMIHKDNDNAKIEIERNDNDWGLATTQLQKLLNYVAKLKPHDVTYTLSIHRVRQLHEYINIIKQQIIEDIKELESHQQDSTDNRIEKALKPLESELKLFSEAAIKLSHFIYSNAILATNDKRQKYIKGFNKKRTVNNVFDKIIEENIELSPTDSNALPVSLFDIEKIKKRLLLANIYGPKFNILSQNESLTNQKMENREEKVTIVNKIFQITQ